MIAVEMDSAAEIIVALGTALAALVMALTGTLTVIVALRRVQLAQAKSQEAQDVIIDQVKTVHTLVNHDRGVILRLSAVSARTLANQFPGDDVYARLAEEAERAVTVHEEQQAKVDAEEK